jgi:hypothetical protein
MVTLRTANSAFSEHNNNYNKNNIREYNIVHGESVQVGKHCYLVCIPDLPTDTSKMEVARAVESRILYSSIGEIQYVKNVVFIQGFDEESKNAIENSCYKIAIVNIEMTPNECGVYTDYENDFYESVCRGDLFIGEWSNVFLMANPNYYFKSVEAAQTAQTAQTVDAAFQKWKHDTDLAKYKCKVDDGEKEIFELQSTVNELLESLRFLSRKRSGEGLVGLKDASKSLSSFISTLNNKYARICVSDVEFLEINKNMKLKKMLGLVVNVCDDCDACQELIHSLDYIGDEERTRDLFVQIDKLICRINHSVRKFQLLHLYAERCIFGLKNRAVFTEFASFLNTAVEIVEEVTSRNCTHTQDVDFIKCYGIRATSKQEKQQAAHDGSCVGDYYSGGCWDASACASWDGSNGYDGITVNNNYYDYFENADNVETDADEMDADTDEAMTSVSQMLAEFDAIRALTATATATATADSVVEAVKVEVEVEVEQQQVVVLANEQSEEVELVMTATAVKEEQQEENEKSSTTNGDNKKGKWFSWF